MTAGLEASAARQWLSAVLTGDATLLDLVPGGIWNGSARQGSPYPLLEYTFSSGIDLAVVGAVRIWTNMLWLIKVIGGTADYLTLDPIVARADALLQRASGSSAAGTVWSCDREQTIEYEEQVVGGHQYRHVGGIYRIYAS